MDNCAIRDYVITHIDEAIEKEWLKVYYQPVVRSITGQLCSTESLARWIDPEVGFLAPDKFIGALEEEKLIHKLDSFIVDRVCHDISDRLSGDLPMVPVSINMSRLDFVMCDMLKVLEDAVEKYDIPRDFIHVEITESMIVQNEDLMSDIITRFRSRGYEIWMDDFGSGYSSLTLLKDYEFDLLKMDMRFLSSMTEKSKTLMRYTIGMAKRIGIKTLSEGVETIEQVEFLKSIGCGKLQGYYYSKPLPLSEMFEAMENKAIDAEERKWRTFYEAASISVHDTDTPLMILEYGEDAFRLLFINAAFRQQAGINTDDISVIETSLFGPNSPALKKYNSFITKVITSKSQESFYYTNRGNYYQLKLDFIDEKEGRNLVKATINNISHDENAVEKDKLDLRLRELNNLYETVVLVNYKGNVLLPLLGGYVYMNELPVAEMTLDEIIMFFSENYVYPEDRLDYQAFMNYDYLNARKQFPSGQFIKDSIRLKQKDGSYEWREISLLSIPGTEGNEYLLTLSKVSDDIAKALNTTRYTQLVTAEENKDCPQKIYARIWDTLVNNSSYKLFWKDKDRRFMGVSKSFLEFYEIESPDDIIGKNDEEMHWHVDDGPYQGDELDVLGKGKIVYNARGQCIVNGVVHNIICNKMPIYENGKIVGLVGTFEDEDQEIYRVQKLLNPSRIDSVTRLMNSKSFLNVMVDYADQYNSKGRNYGYIALHNANHRRLEKTYGSKFASKVLREIGEKIIDIVGQSGVAARPKEAYFGVIIYEDSKEKLEELTLKLKNHIEEVNSVDGNSVTIKMTTACHLRSEEGFTDESIHILCVNEIDDMESSRRR
ncbi:bifunctional diguanylate cyclase/phosphodiesterase [Butyrivibrio sp. FCS014]|uniref:bifunctional diguanylate cyclase/phosphodiesterase n=1 Tax=Butyrivibrio sp. FCS014 TaxID=1408304 RepID=UPI000465AF2C|nr:EAL domain-containing protein [Butyrivibrio sp. FCS014]